MDAVQIPPPPRKIRRRREAGGAWLLWSVVIGGMVLAFTPLALLIARHAVFRAGRLVDATVDGVYLARSNKIDTPHVKFHYFLDGRSLDGDQEITAAERPAMQPGKIVPARVILFFRWPYCFLVLPSVAAHPASQWLVAIGTPVGSWILAWVVYGQDFRDRKLVKTGSAVPGTITGHRISGGRSTSRCIEFEYTPADGVERIGEMQTDAWAYARAKIGDRVTVLYNAARPATAAVYELCTYEASPSDQAGV